ncbi:MAG: phospholipase D-like domain-containing protein, partial [Clostridia bacterium]|nr:phospholipase D-like domain-containing protein [Clostridia bacterium]
FGDGPKPKYREYVARNVYLNLINQAEKDLYVTTPYLIVDDAFIDALRRASLRGVNVNIVIPGIPDKKAVYCMTRQGCSKLIDAGIKIYTYTPGFIHAKGIVADGTCGVVGTINLDYRSFVHHYECGVFMYETQAISELQDDMYKTIAQSKLVISSIKLRWWEKIVCLFANVFRPML